MKGKLAVLAMILIGITLAWVGRRHRMPMPGHVLPERGPILVLCLEGVALRDLELEEGSGTPHLARLAQQSLVFHDTILPALDRSRNARSLLTGRRPSLGGETLLQRLAARGYRTAVFSADGFWVEEPGIDRLEPPEREGSLDLEAVLEHLTRPGDARALPFALLQWELAEERDLSALDGAFGRLWRELGEELRSRLTVVVTSTSGRATDPAAPLTRDRFLQPRIQVPLLVRLPLESAAARRRQDLTRPTTLLDVPVTLLELILERPLEGAGGVSLLETPSGLPRKRICEAREPDRAAVALWMGAIKYVATPPAAGTGPPDEWIVDLRADPAEETNLALSEPGLLQEMRAILRERFGWSFPGWGSAESGAE